MPQRNAAAVGWTAVTTRSFDQLLITHLGGGQRVGLRPSEVETTAVPFIVVYAFGGSVLLRGQTQMDLGNSDFTVVHNRAPLEVSTPSDSEALIIRVPAVTLGPNTGAMGAAVGRVWTERDGMASIVGHLLRGIAVQREDYTPASPARLAQHIVGLMALLCSTAEESQDPHGRAHILQVAKEYIEANLGDVDLGPDQIAAQANISTRTLHRLFEKDGHTVRSWIRARRLEHCRVELADAAWSDHPVSAVGARWGLWDAAHFSRLFKAAYGLSPRAYRIAVREGRFTHAATDRDISRLEEPRITAQFVKLGARNLNAASGVPTRMDAIPFDTDPGTPRNNP